jgi:2-hydroxy-4-carboxymuconate semialdehyde hemiacetal dehydrogenase
VAAIHAACLSKHADVVTVVGPDGAKAKRFAQHHEIPNATDDLRTAFASCDAAIICSPSPAHFLHGREALQNAVNALIELPACASVAEAETLRAIAESHNLIVQCAHTSRYAESYERIARLLSSDALGDIRHITYVRSIPPRKRSWIDDALLHHAEHPLDLLLYWFGSVRAHGCVAHPGIPGPQDVSLLASICNGVPVSISISYTTHLPDVKMTIIGADHTIATDGSTYIHSDNPALTWHGDDRQVYEAAIEKQDAAFLQACRDRNSGIPWSETTKLIQCVEDFAKRWHR